MSALKWVLGRRGQLRDILEYVRIGVEEDKVEVLCGGERLTEGEFANGAFMCLTIKKGLQQVPCCSRRTLWPVAVVIPFETEEEVIAMANGSIYGLGGAVFSTDINRAYLV